MPQQMHTGPSRDQGDAQMGGCLLFICVPVFAIFRMPSPSTISIMAMLYESGHYPYNYYKASEHPFGPLYGITEDITNIASIQFIHLIVPAVRFVKHYSSHHSHVPSQRRDWDRQCQETFMPICSVKPPASACLNNCVPMQASVKK